MIHATPETLLYTTSVYYCYSLESKTPSNVQLHPTTFPYSDLQPAFNMSPKTLTENGENLKL